MVLITFTNDKSRFVKVMVVRAVFFCDVKTRICETLALRQDFRIIS